MPRTKPKNPKGRPKGTTNARPRAKRLLTSAQKLREHVLIELGLDKADIAQALGATRQNVSQVFLDDYRSDLEERIVAYLAERYEAAYAGTRTTIDTMVRRGTGYEGYPTLTPETLGWSRRSSPTPPEEPSTWLSRPRRW